jgi:manganese/zinc/iron transport system ATP- binding protein
MKKINYAVETEGLTVAYDAKPVLWDIDLKIPKGNITAVMGPNGAGKTTLIRTMLGMLTPVSGSVLFQEGGYMRGGEKRNRIAYVPQSGSVDWDFPATALDVTVMGRYGLLGWFRRPGKKDREAALEALRQVGMENFASRQISQLSGGQQQRVFLARALVQEADIYFMDEPFKGVDAQTEKTIILLLKKLKEQGKTIIVVHHDLQTVREYFDWVVLINISVVASGNVSEVFNEENLARTYRVAGLAFQGAV